MASSQFTALQLDQPTKSQVRKYMFECEECQGSCRTGPLNDLTCAAMMAGNDFNNCQIFQDTKYYL